MIVTRPNPIHGPTPPADAPPAIVDALAATSIATAQADAPALQPAAFVQRRLELRPNPILNRSTSPASDRPPLQCSRNPILNPRPTAARVEREMAALPHLQRDHAIRLAGTRQETMDARKVGDAVAAIGRLPAVDESLHLAIGGSFALFHIVPAVLELSSQRIDSLTIATLGFSKANITGLCELIDAGQIGRLDLLCSHYFKSTSEATYTFAEAELSRRPAARFLSCRSHAKLLLIALADGRRLTVESSANLRSCKNIEQATIIGSPAVFTFHREWIDDLFQRGGK